MFSFADPDLDPDPDPESGYPHALYLKLFDLGGGVYEYRATMAHGATEITLGEPVGSGVNILIAEYDGAKGRLTQHTEQGLVNSCPDDICVDLPAQTRTHQLGLAPLARQIF